MTNSDWTIIYHTADSTFFPHIHKNFYEKSNPSANILYADGRNYYLPKPKTSMKVKDVNDKVPDLSKPALRVTTGFSKRLLVRNHDKFLRDWLKDNFDKIKTNNVAFFEWDVLLNKKLPSLVIDDLYVKCITNKNKPWYRMKEITKYNNTLPISTGFAPFGAFYTNKNFVEQMINSRYDSLYNENLFCECRLTILAYYTNTNIVEYDDIVKPLSCHKDGKKILKGCFHPVKTRFDVNKI